MDEKTLFYLALKKIKELDKNRSNLLINRLDKLTKFYNNDFNLVISSREFLDICNIIC